MARAPNLDVVRAVASEARLRAARILAALPQQDARATQSEAIEMRARADAMLGRSRNQAVRHRMPGWVYGPGGDDEPESR